MTHDFPSELSEIISSGWIEPSSSDYPTEAGLSKENRYLWERKRTIYTQSPSTYEVSLLAQFDSGLCENLLENTAFNDINDMDAWQIRNGSVVERALDNTNGFKKSPDTAAITDFLQQHVLATTATTPPQTWRCGAAWERVWKTTANMASGHGRVRRA